MRWLRLTLSGFILAVPATLFVAVAMAPEPLWDGEAVEIEPRCLDCGLSSVEWFLAGCVVAAVVGCSLIWRAGR